MHARNSSTERPARQPGSATDRLRIAPRNSDKSDASRPSLQPPRHHDAPFRNLTARTGYWKRLRTGAVATARSPRQDRAAGANGANAVIDRNPPKAMRRRTSDSGETRFPKFRHAFLPEAPRAHPVARIRSLSDGAGRGRPTRMLRDRVIVIRSHVDAPPAKRPFRRPRSDDRRHGRRYRPNDAVSISNAPEAASGPHGYSRSLPNPVLVEIRLLHRPNQPVAAVISARPAPQFRPRFPFRGIASTMTPRPRLFSRFPRTAR